MSEKVVSFVLGKEEFGVDISKVREIIVYRGATKMPNVSEYVEGIVNIRGKIIPVVDMKCKLSIVGETAAERYAMIVEIGNQQVAILVDQVKEVQEISDENIEAPPTISEVECQMIRGIGKIGERLCILLDIDAVFAKDEVIKLGRIVN